MKTLYEKSMFFLYALLLFFVPLLVSPITQEYFEFSKMFLTYFVSGIVVALFLLNKVWNYSASQIGLFKYAIWFFIAAILSTIFSTDIYVSVWGYYSRFNGGLLSILSFLSLSFISFNTFKKNDFIQLAFFSVLSGLLVSGYGIIQHFMDLDLERVYSTIGQPNWLAQYLGIILPFIVILYSKSKFDIKDYRDWILLSIYVIIFYCLWLTFSMSGFLGLFISLFFLPKLNSKKLLILGFSSLVIVIVNFATLGFLINRVTDIFIEVKSSLLTEIIPSVYAAGESYKVSDPGYIRKNIWKQVLYISSISPKNLMFGTGLQTFPFEFQAFRPTELNYSSEWDYLVNRPHNYYLELLSEIGIMGLMFYMHFIKITLDNAPKYLKCSLVVFYVTNIFGWPVVSTNLLFWMIVSYISLNNLSKSS